jgi:hypothetical protein
VPTRIPASERTSQKLDERLTRGVTDGDARAVLLKLAVRKIVLIPLDIPYGQHPQAGLFPGLSDGRSSTFLLWVMPPPHHQLHTALTINRPVSSRILLQRSPTASSKRSISSAVIT